MTWCPSCCDDRFFDALGDGHGAYYLLNVRKTTASSSDAASMIGCGRDRIAAEAGFGFSCGGGDPAGAFGLDPTGGGGLRMLEEGAGGLITGTFIVLGGGTPPPPPHCAADDDDDDGCAAGRTLPANPMLPMLLLTLPGGAKFMDTNQKGLPIASVPFTAAAPIAEDDAQTSCVKWPVSGEKPGRSKS